MSARHPAGLAALCLAVAVVACGGSSSDGARNGGPPVARATSGDGGPAYLLLVSKIGRGQGTVTSTPAGIDCGETCYTTLALGTIVTLTATPIAPSTFGGWSGAGCAGTAPTCEVTLADVTNLMASFTDGDEPSLVIEMGGTGFGRITSDVGGIDCPGTCSTVLPAGTPVTLTASPLPGSLLIGLGGACGYGGASPTCTVTVAAGMMVAAGFRLATDPNGVSVLRLGDGGGLVTSSPEGIDCGETCAAGFAPGTVVTLTATPGPWTTFDGWTGECTGTDPICVVIADQGRSLSATFTASGPPAALTVSTNATGDAGVVYTSDFAIQCGQNCSHTYTGGTVVTLTANMNVASKFLGWGGACSGTALTCVVSMTEDRAVTATFEIGTVYILNVQPLGRGSISVSGQTLVCPPATACGYGLAAGTTVTVTAMPSADMEFTGWGGDCTGTAPCVLTMSGYHAVTATFVDPNQRFTLSAVVAGTGAGRITSTPEGIDCGAACSASYPTGAVVTVTATPSAGNVFVGWSGPCGGTAPTCVLTMGSALAVVAIFEAPNTTYSLAVTRAGPGTGRILSIPAGIECGTTCSAAFASGTLVTLTATAAPGSAFAGWAGECTGAGPTCVVRMAAARSVIATFGSYATAGGGCQVSYQVTRQRPGEFEAALVVRNTSATAWTGWTVTWTWPTANQRITRAWNATASQTGQAVTLRSTRHDGSIPAGGSYAEVRIKGKWRGTNPPPASFSVNGTRCE